MIRISEGKIRLETKIIDLSEFQIRPKTTEQDLEREYDSFISHTCEIRDYFEDTSAFDIVIHDASSDKRPKLVARDTKYPFMWAFRTAFMPFDFLRPSTRRMHDDYFMVAHCITKIPIKKRTGEEETGKPLDEKLKGDILDKFREYPGYEGILEISNDMTPSQTKSTTFHEALHYIVARYQAETERNFVDASARKDLIELEKYQIEHLANERAVEILTDKLLSHDSDAQFENRWGFYSLNNRFRHLSIGVSASSTGAFIAMSFSYPYLIPLAFVPGRVRDYVLKRYKDSKRGEVLKPVEYPKFKI